MNNESRLALKPKQMAAVCTQGPENSSVGIGGPFGRDGDSDVDVLAAWGFIKRRRNIIAAAAGLVAVVCAAVIMQIKPLFTAEATVMLDLRQQGADVETSLAGIPMIDMAVLRTEVEVLRSRRIATKVAAKIDLAARSEFGAGENPDSEAIVAGLLSKTTIVNDGRSYVLRVQVTTLDPGLSAEIANAYVDVYLFDQMESKFESVRRSNEWLNDNLTEMREQVAASARAVQEFTAANKLAQNKGATVAGQQVTELGSQLVLASTNRAQKEASLRQLQDLMKSGDISATAQVLSSPLIQDLRKQEAEVLRQEAQMTAKYKAEHPAMVKIRAQAADLHDKIVEESGRIVRSLEADVTTARMSEELLRESLKKIESAIEKENAAWPQLQELERQATADRLLYENFLGRFRQTSTQQDYQKADARLLSAATPPQIHSYPRTKFLLALSIVGALFAGIIVAYGVERLDSGFRSNDQIERMARVTVMGIVPEFATDSALNEMVITHPTSQFAESLRTIRTALRYSNIDNPPKTVLVTSAMPQEGKSHFAAALALSSAHSGRKTLLIDCDLRRPTVASIFDIEPKASLPSIFDDPRGEVAAIHVDAASGLHFLPATTGALNPQDILGSARMEALLRKMESRYDLIVLDSPPVLAVSDASVLAHMVDAALFLVRWGTTPRRTVVEAINAFRSHGCQVTGAVLSRVDTERYATYGYESASYYYSEPKQNSDGSAPRKRSRRPGRKSGPDRPTFEPNAA